MSLFVPRNREAAIPKMKRGRPYDFTASMAQRRAEKRKRFSAPRRTYAGSMVPLRTGGYKPNTVERKVNDIGVSTYQINSTGTITLLANPVLGSDFNQRIGRKVILKSVYIRGYVANEASTAIVDAANPSMLTRLIVFADLQPNGATPAVTDLLVSASPSAQLNLNNRDRFKIYCDKEWVFDPYFINAVTGMSTGSRQIWPVKKYKKLNLEMIFNGTNGGTIADINSGALYMLWIGSVAAGVNQDANASISTRVRYNDA